MDDRRGKIWNCLARRKQFVNTDGIIKKAFGRLGGR